MKPDTRQVEYLPSGQAAFSCLNILYRSIPSIYAGCLWPPKDQTANSLVQKCYEHGYRLTSGIDRGMQVVVTFYLVLSPLEAALISDCDCKHPAIPPSLFQ